MHSDRDSIVWAVAENMDQGRSAPCGKEPFSIGKFSMELMEWCIRHMVAADLVVGQLRDVQQRLEAVGQLHKGAIVHQAHHPHLVHNTLLRSTISWLCLTSGAQFSHASEKHLTGTGPQKLPDKTEMLEALVKAITP